MGQGERDRERERESGARKRGEIGRPATSATRPCANRSRAIRTSHICTHLYVYMHTSICIHAHIYMYTCTYSHVCMFCTHARDPCAHNSYANTDKALGEQIQGIPFSVKQIVLPRNSHKSGHEHLTMPKGTMQLTFENRDHGPIEHGPVDDIRVRDQGVGNRGHDTCHRQRVPCKPPNLCPCSGMGVGRLRSRVRRTGGRRQIKTVSTHAR